MVDDNRTDILLLRKALQRANFAYDLTTAADGQAATDLLEGGLNGSETIRPDLVLLDLNMPRKDGFQVLKQLKENPKMGGIPVVIYSSSSRPEDVERCYALHASSYISKPVTFEDLTEIAAMIRSYWFQSVLLVQ